MPGVLKDKVAIITGGGRGIGKAFALKYAEEGAKLFLPDINLEQAQEAAKEIKAKGGEAAAIQTDISDEQSCQGSQIHLLHPFCALSVQLSGDRQRSAAGIAPLSPPPCSPTPSHSVSFPWRA